MMGKDSNQRNLTSRAPALGLPVASRRGNLSWPFGVGSARSGEQRHPPDPRRGTRVRIVRSCPRAPRRSPCVQSV